MTHLGISEIYKIALSAAFLSLDCFRTLSFNFHNFEPTFELSFVL